jgi:hypothetical protein
VNCPYLLHVIEHLSFNLRWRNWVSSLWCSASSFILNGEQGKRILHCRGVRQGGPLSPLLFILAMEPLHRIFLKAQSMGILERLSPGCDAFRVSLYAYDAAIFIRPSEDELKITTEILHIFAQASGLVTNINKTECFPIQCSNTNLDFLNRANMAISQFPCKYLGLPLHYKKPTRAMFQSVIQKVGGRLPGWKRNLLPTLGGSSL